MARQTRIITIITVLTISMIGALGYMLFFDKPHIDISDSLPNITLSSNILIHDFESNENKANKKYLEQIIQVTGTITEISNTKNKGIVTLSNEDSLGSIMCHLSPLENKKIKALKKGQNITIKGLCTGYLMDVILIKCSIVD